VSITRKSFELSGIKPSKKPNHTKNYSDINSMQGPFSTVKRIPNYYPTTLAAH